jgi:hypothetical protein
MSKKSSSKQRSQNKKPQESVFKEAWGNMNDDMFRVMPGFLTKLLKDRKSRMWVMVAVTCVELIVLGVVGKFIYDWFVQ